MPAGYYEQTDSRIPAIKVARIPPAQALASFTLKGGQLLSQRMHLKTPSQVPPAGLPRGRSR